MATRRPRQYRIAWRPMAESDLERIVDHVAQDGPITALEFVEELREKAGRLAMFPLVGREGRPGLPGYVRELVVHKNYILLYRVKAKDKTVEILRVRHAALESFRT
ncbi:MAG: type II toxin-antitoxin system RelE/ParE family toxin [Burkholderiaceae bacterium]